MLWRYIKLLTFSYFSCSYTHSLKAGKSVGVRFNESLNWQQVQAKARDENKFIFVDCIATWCGPCKEMDKSTYQAYEVANCANNHFISIKVQMDSTSHDSEQVKSWYADACTIMRKYGVKRFPAFLFFSPDGRIVHSDFGYKDSTEFMNLLEDAVDPKRQYFTLLSKYRKGENDYLSLPYLAKLVKKFGDKELSKVILNDYLQNYLYKLSERKVFTKEHIGLIVSNVRNSKEKGFYLIYKHEEKVDQLMHQKNYAEIFIENIIYDEEIYPNLFKDGFPVTEAPDWDKMINRVSEKYKQVYAESVLLSAKIRWYSFKKDWPRIVKYRLQKLEREGLDTTIWGMKIDNDILYDVIFMHSHDEKALGKALQWEGILLTRNPDNPGMLDTYANLLYKLKRKDALDYEERAANLAPKDKEIESNLNKMRKGEATWVDD